MESINNKTGRKKKDISMSQVEEVAGNSDYLALSLAVKEVTLLSDIFEEMVKIRIRGISH